MTGLAIARAQTARIARLNDLAHRAMGIACTAVATVGFRSLPEADQSRVRELIETFDAFDEDNDPHGERDFGTIHQLADGNWTTERPRLCEEGELRKFISDPHTNAYHHSLCKYLFLKSHSQKLNT